MGGASGFWAGDFRGAGDMELARRYGENPRSFQVLAQHCGSYMYDCHSRNNSLLDSRSGVGADSEWGLSTRISFPKVKRLQTIEIIVPIISPSQLVSQSMNQ